MNVSSRLVIVVSLLFLLIGTASSYSVSTSIQQGATVYIGEQGLNLSPAQMNGAYKDPSGAGPLVPPLRDQDAATIGWWPSVAVIGSSPPTRTVSLLSTNTSFLVNPTNFVGYTGNWYLVNQTNNYADLPAFFTVSDPTLDLQVWNLNTSADVTSTTVPRGNFLGFRINTNMNNAVNAQYRGPVYNTSDDGYIDIRVKNQSAILFTALMNSSGSSNTLTKQNVSTQPWTWGTAPGAPFNWSTGVLSGGVYAYVPGNYSVYAESGLNGMKDNYKNAGADYSGKTVSPVYFVVLSANPVADFTATPLTGIYPLTVQFTDQTSGPATTWNWSFGDGITSSLQNPSHLYMSTGAYTVTLSVTNAHGSDTLTKSTYITVTMTTTPGDSGDSGPAPAPAPAPVPVVPQVPQVPPLPVPEVPELPGQPVPGVPVPEVPGAPGMQPVEGLAGVTVAESYPVGYTGLSYNTAGDDTVSIDLASAREAGAVVSRYFDRIESYQHNSPGVLITFWGDAFREKDGMITGKVTRAELKTDPLTVNVSSGRVSGSMQAVITSIGRPVEVANAITGDIPAGTAGTYSRILAQENQSVAGIAYLMKFSRGNLTRTGAANVTMAVPASWVGRHGGKDAVRIARTSDETGRTELLATTYTGLDAGGNMVFRGDSPNGTSLFGLITAQATAAEQQAHPDVTYIPASKPAMITNVGMFSWLLDLIQNNPLLILGVIAVLAAAAYFGWWKRRL